MKTSELQGAALDWAVAKCERHEVFTRPIANAQHKYWVGIVTHDYQTSREGPFMPSEQWAQGGPIIEREKIALNVESGDPWRARFGRPRLTFDGRATNYHHRDGPTPLIAAMRCYVASKLGDEVEIPEELL